MLVAHLVTGVGGKAGNRKAVAELVDGPGQQRHRFLGQLQQRLVAAGHGLVQRFGKVQQQQYRDAAPVGAVAHVDAGIRRVAGAPVHHGAQRHIQVQFAALFLIADAHPLLWLEQVQQPLELPRQAGVPGQQPVDGDGIARRLQAVVHTHPVRAVGAGGGVPLGVQARGQGCVVIGGAAAARALETVFLVACFDEAPQVAVVVAPADNRVFEKNARELVAGAAGAGHVPQRQLRHGGGAGFALGHQRLERGDAVQEVRVGFTVIRVQQRAGHAGQPVAQARGGFGIAIAGLRMRVQRQQDAAQAGVEAAGQRVHPRILEKLHRQPLEGAPVVGHQRRAPAPVRRHVGQRGAVAVHAAHAGFIVQHIGQAQAQRVEIRHRLAQLVERGGIGHQQRGVVPQRFQRALQAPLHVGEQRAVAFALQHGAAVGRLQTEIVGLALRVAAVVAHAVVHPALQPVECQRAQQARRGFQEGRQARAFKSGVVAVDGAAGARHQRPNQVEIGLQRLASRQAPRHGG